MTRLLSPNCCDYFHILKTVVPETKSGHSENKIETMFSDEAEGNWSDLMTVLKR